MFSATQGNAQHINIQDLIGNDYTLNKRRADPNSLLGLGYFVNIADKKAWHFAYGLSAFYFAKTTVAGNIIQESLFQNLSYQYHISHFPIYVTVKTIVNHSSDKSAITLDAGIGPNIMMTSDYHTNSLDGGITLQDHTFSGQSCLTLSATAGVSIRLNKILGSMPIELGYRFFYLGKGSLHAETNQTLNTLRTGSVYANALLLTFVI